VVDNKIIQFLCAFAKLRHATNGFVMSVRPQGTARVPIDRFSRNLKFDYFSKICTFMIMFCVIPVGMRNISEKGCKENQNTHITFNNSPPPENRAVYEIMWKNMAELDRPHTTLRRMRLACWLFKATDIPSKYVILIAFPRQ